jgi:hypothetical protein
MMHGFSQLEIVERKAEREVLKSKLLPRLKKDLRPTPSILHSTSSRRCRVVIRTYSESAVLGVGSPMRRYVASTY